MVNFGQSNDPQILNARINALVIERNQLLNDLQQADNRLAATTDFITLMVIEHPENKIERRIHGFSDLCAGRVLRAHFSRIDDVFEFSAELLSAEESAELAKQETTNPN